MSKRVLLFLLAPVFLMVVGCSQSPSTEMDSTEMALQAAVDAEADQYVPELYQKALDSLNAAKIEIQKQDGKFALFRSYGGSRGSLAAAEKLAEEAANEAAIQKESVRSEVEAMMLQADTAIAMASKALASAPKAKGTRADLQMIKADIDGLKNTYNEAATEFNNGKFLVAKSKLEAVMDKAASIMGEIEKAKTVKSGK